MAWLTELQKDNISNHITDDVTVLSRRYKSKKKEFDEQSVEINEIEDWEKEDWEVISKSKDATSQKANGIQKEDISFIYLTQTNSVHCLEVIR